MILLFKRKNNLSKLLFLFFFSIFLIAYIKGEEDLENSFTVITPSKVIEEIEKINKGGQIPYRIGKFGEVPFGKTVLAMIFIKEQTDGSNYWCNYDTTSTPPEIKKYSSIYKEYIPMILVDQGQCSYSKKALNVQLRGGSVMMIVDDDNNLNNNDKYNILDLRGNSIKIPAIVIPRNYGDIIKDFIREQKINKTEKLEDTIDPIIVSIKFSAYNPDGTIEMNLFMSSDDLNAIYFFKEFDKYKMQIGDKFKFNPIYKYHDYKLLEHDNNIKNKGTTPCFSKNDIKYCSTNNTDLKIVNPRFVLLENLRQSCIFINHGVDTYWKYMIKFGELCTNLLFPIFNEECSKTALYQIKLNDKDYNKIETCMQDLIDFNSKVDDDFQLYNYRKVYEYPLITLNGIKFKGIWLPRTIFNSICTSFIKDEKICGSPKVQDLSKNSQVYPASLIIFIILFLFLFTIVLVICYRRIAYRSIEQTLIEKIHTETIRSIGKHSQKKDEKDNLEESS